ncbi:MAG: DUF5103 domain-containing protein [Flavobacteriales bacterium]|nr:DUF5103 domain-containing protein [Flavobacteriales bacterium]
MKSATLLAPLVALLFASADLHAAAEEGVLTDRTYSPTIRTVQFFKKGFALAPPVLELAAQEPLVLRFDDLQANTENLSYTLVHCDADWRPSDLMPTQYLQGSPYDMVPGPASSFNTLQNFLEYEVEVPNEVMRPTISGNYVIKVYRSGDESDVVLTRRFLIFEQRVQVDARLTASRDVEVRDIAQQLDLTVRYPGVNVQDPFNDLKVTVLQNFRWDDARTGLRPKFIRDRELIYDMPPQALFRGGNEWRNYDIKDIRFATQRIAHIRPGPLVYEITLLPDPSRNIKVYFDQPDLNGRMLVRNDDVDGDPLGTDYVKVSFTLPMEMPLAGGEVFVYGALSDMQCQERYRMQWNETRKAYELEALVKQGFVDYVYAWLPAGAEAPDLTRFEGSHFQTENDYVVLVHVRDHTLRCDKLMALEFLNTRRPK